MLSSESRRAFLKNVAAGSAFFASTSVSPVRRLSADSEQPNRRSATVPLQPEIEPVVRLLEDTPREKLVETVAERIHQGLSYHDVLAALLLAGVRNVEPRPLVGFKFHAVLVVPSVHSLSIAASERDRGLPIFWALHDFKFGGAVLEDVLQLSPAWRAPYLASAVFHLQGSGQKDNPLVERTRRALAG